MTDDVSNKQKLPAWGKPGDYRARMEALEGYAMHHIECMAGGDCPCICGLDALLAACEREGER